MFTEFINLIFPRTCLACQNPLVQSEDFICTNCMLSLPKTDSHLQRMEEIHQKFYGNTCINHAFSYLKYMKGSVSQKLIHQLKYKNKPEIGRKLGNWYGSDLKAAGFGNEFDVIIPVPLNEAKLKSRGYNQAEMFANGLAEAMELKLDKTSLRRILQNSSQISKNRLERYENLQHNFALNNSENLKNKRVLLVDDTLTTGATLTICAELLLQMEVKSLSIATISNVFLT